MWITNCPNKTQTEVEGTFIAPISGHTKIDIWGDHENKPGVIRRRISTTKLRLQAIFCFCLCQWWDSLDLKVWMAGGLCGVSLKILREVPEVNGTLYVSVVTYWAERKNGSGNTKLQDLRQKK